MLCCLLLVGLTGYYSGTTRAGARGLRLRVDFVALAMVGVQVEHSTLQELWKTNSTVVLLHDLLGLTWHLEAWVLPQLLRHAQCVVWHTLQLGLRPHLGQLPQRETLGQNTC